MADFLTRVDFYEVVLYSHSKGGFKKSVTDWNQSYFQTQKNLLQHSWGFVWFVVFGWWVVHFNLIKTENYTQCWPTYYSQQIFLICSKSVLTFNLQIFSKALLVLKCNKQHKPVFRSSSVDWLKGAVRTWTSTGQISQTLDTGETLTKNQDIFWLHWITTPLCWLRFDIKKIRCVSYLCWGCKYRGYWTDCTDCNKLCGTLVIPSYVNDTDLSWQQMHWETRSTRNTPTFTTFSILWTLTVSLKRWLISGGLI